MGTSMMKLVVLCAVVAIAAAIPSDFNNDVILKGRRSALANPCTCATTKCASTPAPVNGQLGTCTSAGLSTAGTCIPTCNTGYYLVGTQHTCTNGYLTQAKCHPNKCALPPAASTAPSNGAVGSCNANIAAGGSCQQTCTSATHKLTAGGKFSCPTNGGTATGSTATCTPKCAAISTNPANGAAGTCNAKTDPGKTCTQGCNAGFELTAGGTYTCPSGGTTATGTKGTCTAQCAYNTANNPTNGGAGKCSTSITNAAANKIDLGKSCTTGCNAGFELTAAGVWSCPAAGGTATGTKGTCTAQCAYNTANNPTNGNAGTCAKLVKNSAANKIDLGKSCKQACNAGYTLTAGGDYSCPTAGGTATGTKATCTKDPTCTVTGCSSALNAGSSCNPTCAAVGGVATVLVGSAKCGTSGGVTCTTGCHVACKSGNYCIKAGSADACTKCADGYEMVFNNGQTYGTCMVGGGKVPVTINRAVTFDAAYITAAAFKGNKQTGLDWAYGNQIGITSSSYAAGSANMYSTGCSLKSSIVSRRSTTKINYKAIVSAALGTTAWNSAKSFTIANLVTKINSIQAAAGLGSITAAKIKALSTATVEHSSASTTSITGILSLLVAAWCWTQQ